MIISGSFALNNCLKSKNFAVSKSILRPFSLGRMLTLFQEYDLLVHKTCDVHNILRSSSQDVVAFVSQIGWLSIYRFFSDGSDLLNSLSFCVK